MKTSTPGSTPLPSVEGVTIGELLATLASGRWIILGGAAVGLILAGLLILVQQPVYEVTALVQVLPKQASSSRPALEAKVESISQVTSQIQAEMEIFQSNQVLGRAVRALNLDLFARPKRANLLFPALQRHSSQPPALELDTFDMPDSARGEVFSLVSQGDGRFEWLDPAGKQLATGRTGESVQADWHGQPLELKVRRMETRPGQRFEIGRQQVLDTIEDLRTALTVGEKVKESDILALSLQNTSPERGAEVLNAILDQYILENIEQRTREATRTLAILQDELADHRDKEMRAEGSLVMSKSSARSADPSEESRLILQRTSDVERDILAARQKRDELLRTYKASADVVRIVDEQIAKLQEERGRLQARAQALPQAQQEASRLSKEVQVSQDRYGALTSLQAMAIQQLQLAKAGEISSVRIVDRAWPTLRPIKPRKSLIAALGLILGTVAGMTAVLVAYTMKNKGVQDPQVLESTFGMPVLATIPHSKAQSDLTRRLEKQEDAHALLAVTHPTDLAVESLRSLRTSLHYALVDAPNRSILLAGPSPDIGKSFVCLNFATILAQYGAKVLLVDADMRKGRLHKYFGIENRLKGLSEVLVGSLRWQDAVHSLHGVDLLSTGTLPPNPSKLLVGERFTAFMKEACEAYDYVLFDAPPVLAVTDAAILGAHVGATLLLLKDSQHPLGEIRTALQSLDIAGAKVKGFVFNDIDSEGARAGYRRYTYHYTYEA